MSDDTRVSTESGSQTSWCSHEINPNPWGGARTCARQATRLVRGRPYCWQHAEIALRPHMHWEQEERDLTQLRAGAPRPQSKQSWLGRLFYRLGMSAWADDHLKKSCYASCSYCDRRPTTSRMAVNPLTLQRSKHPLCSREECEQKLRVWEGAGNSRRARAELDWQHENGISTSYDLSKGIPTQYPSLSRATLREFLDSGMPVATVEGAGERTVASLNGSIRTLGFADQVYAEIRSGEAVLRRIEVSNNGSRVGAN